MLNIGADNRSTPNIYIYIYIYIYIRGVTDHKIHGSIRHSGVTVWYVFDGGALDMSQCRKYFCFKP